MSLFSAIKPSGKSRSVRFPIAYKLALVIALLIIVIMSLLGLLVISNQKRVLEQQMADFGNSMAQLVAEATKDPILANDRLALDVIISNLVSLKNIDGAALYSDEGTVLTTQGEIPADLPPLKTDAPLIVRSDRAITFISPVTFRQLTAGHVLLSMGRAPLEVAKRQTIQTISLFTLLMVILGIIVSLVAGKRLTRPIDTLIDGSKTIHDGDYSFRFSEQRNDEIGLLMDSLNGLTEGLLRKEQVEQALSRYVSPEVASTVLSNLEQVQLGGKRVYASVLFADIVGFTHLSETMEPAEINALLNEYFSLIDRVAQCCRGHVDKFMGDCAMLVFGTPGEDEAHALHAVECAILIHRMTDWFNHKREQNGELVVRFGIGINSGQMLAGNTGSKRRMDYTVVGDSVNLASRLSGIADAGETVVSETLHDTADLENYFHTTQEGAINIRGKTEGVAIYKIIGTQSQHDGELQRRMDRIIEGDT